MLEPQVLNTLNSKRLEIEAHIASLERDLGQARADLSGVLAAIRVFSGEGVRVTAYMQLTRLFPRHELPKLCRAALEAAQASISTREIAAHFIAAKGMDVSDRYLRKAITYKVINLMRRWERERRVERVGKRAGH